MFGFLVSMGLTVMAQPTETAAAQNVDCGTYGEAVTPYSLGVELCGVRLGADQIFMDETPVSPALPLPAVEETEQSEVWVVREGDLALVGVRGGDNMFDSMMMIKASGLRTYAPVYCGPRSVMTVSRFQGRQPRYVDVIGQGWEDTRVICRLDFQEWMQTAEIEQFGN